MRKAPNWIDLREKLCDYLRKVDALFQPSTGKKKLCHRVAWRILLAQDLFLVSYPFQVFPLQSKHIIPLVHEPYQGTCAESSLLEYSLGSESHFADVVPAQITPLMIVIQISAKLFKGQPEGRTINRIRNLVSCATNTQSMAPTWQIRLFAFQH